MTMPGANQGMVIPTQAGIQSCYLDAGVRRHDVR